MKENEVLDVIKSRRSVYSFSGEDIADEELEAVLEAGRWAPSYANLQPWKFVVVEDEEVKEELYEVARSVTIFRGGIKQAPKIIAVAVDSRDDPRHFVEAGAVATQNMALAAWSLGIASYWVGVFDRDGEKGSAERRARKALNLPDGYRLISLMPMGKSDQKVVKERKELEELIVHDRFK